VSRQARRSTVDAYEYYHGVDGFKHGRISPLNLTSDAPELLGDFTAERGAVFWSEYQRFVMLGTAPGGGEAPINSPNPMTGGLWRRMGSGCWLRILKDSQLGEANITFV
jgi:hypothetical protein